MKGLLLEQRAFLVYMLGNIGVGMLLFLVLSPNMFTQNMLAYYLVLPLTIVEFILMGKVNYDGFRLGMVDGFCKNSRYRKTVTSSTTKVDSTVTTEK
jgi:hypothetical protein